MRRSACVLVAIVATSGCSIGMTNKTFTPARAPAGVIARITMPSRTLSAEVLEVRDAELVVLGGEESVLRDGRPSTPEVWIIPYAAMDSAQFQQMFALRGGQPPSPVQREKLRLVSRFPQGLSTDLIRALLDAHGQAGPKEVRRAR